MKEAQRNVVIKNVKINSLQNEKEDNIVKYPVFEYRKYVKKLENEIKNQIHEIFFD